MDQRELARLADAVAAKLLGNSNSGSTRGFQSRGAAQASAQANKSHAGAVAAGPSTFVAPSARASASVEIHVPRTARKSAVAFATLDEAVEAARAAQPAWVALPMERRRRIIETVRARLRESVEELSRLAVEETGLGRIEDKRSKNLLVINKTPGPEFLETEAYTGDDGLALIEYAPYGIIGAITPTTNPSETVINNGISMLSAGNAVVFNPHPSARRVSTRAMEIINDAIVSEGGPSGTLTTVTEPTIETAQALMKHKGVRLLVVTGGPAVVKAAMNSGKKVIAAGPGNPPVVVDETADLDQAAEGIIKGASLDNNIVCIAEKEIIAVDSIADSLMKKLAEKGGFRMSEFQARQLEKVVCTWPEGPEGKKKYPIPNKDFVGRNAGVILESIGVKVGPETRIAFCEAGEDHPFVQGELLMPVLPLVRVPNVEAAIEMARRVEHGFGHTACMYSKNIDNLHTMAKVINTSIFIKNGPSYSGLGLGGEGYTSFTIASPTGEGLTTCRDFSRVRRCTLKDHFRIV